MNKVTLSKYQLACQVPRRRTHRRYRSFTILLMLDHHHYPAPRYQLPKHSLLCISSQGNILIQQYTVTRLFYFLHIVNNLNFDFRSGTVHPNISNTNNIPNNNSSNSNTGTSTNIPIHDSSSPPSSSTYNNSHVTQAQAQAVSQALSQAQEGVPASGQTQQNQPVEFNHAINYVNKIKVSFINWKYFP